MEQRQIDANDWCLEEKDVDLLKIYLIIFMTSEIVCTVLIWIPVQRYLFERTMSVRHGARKWLTSFFSDSMGVATVLNKSNCVSKDGAKTSGSIAKERLQIILAHQRGSQVLAGVDLQALQTELLACVQRHIKVSNGANINIAGIIKFN